MSTGDKNRLRKTYSFFRSPPVFASGGGGGGGGASVDQFWHSTTNNSIYTTGSVIVRGGDTAYDSPLDKGTDLFFYVSGSAGTRGTSTAGTALFGGDLVVSGSLSAQGDIVEITGSLIVTNGISGSLTKLGDGTSYLVAGNNITIVTSSNGSITLSSTGGSVSTDDFFDSATAGSIFTTGSAAFKGAEPSIDSPMDKGSDVFFYVSGSRNSKDGISPGVSLFGGDMVISGSFIGFGDTMEITGTLKVTNGISGSLTKLTDGTSYLVAGNNISIVSASNGSITVSSAAPSVAGNNTNVQFNATGSFSASPNFNFYSPSTLAVTGSFEMKGDILPDADMSHSLGSSSKRWSNVYTGDLHLRNERGNWTIVEENDYLCVINNNTGKRYKMMLQPLDDY
jgi:hypothetical protein